MATLCLFLRIELLNYSHIRNPDYTYSLREVSRMRITFVMPGIFFADFLHPLQPAHSARSFFTGSLCLWMPVWTNSREKKKSMVQSKATRMRRDRVGIFAR